MDFSLVTVTWFMRSNDKPQFDLEDLPSKDAGPARGDRDYDPSYGYEPYWADGDWVFDKRPDTKNDTEFGCGTRCSRVYTEYGVICGRNRDFKYKTFENFCTLMNEDCSGVERWMILYRGACYRELIEYDRAFPQTNARQHISSFLAAHTITASYVGYCVDCPSKYA